MYVIIRIAGAFRRLENREFSAVLSNFFGVGGNALYKVLKFTTIDEIRGTKKRK
jgi:hypothetical protein